MLIFEKDYVNADCEIVVTNYLSGIEDKTKGVTEIAEAIVRVYFYVFDLKTNKTIFSG